MIFLLIIPINVFAYSNYIIPGGQTIGIEVNSKGVLVIGFYKVNGKYIAEEAGFEKADIIEKVNNKTVNSIDEMIAIINENYANEITFSIKRLHQKKNIKLKLTKDNNILKTGLYVKDKINGIGTLTYIDPTTKVFGSLGHEIIDSKTMTKFEIKDGKIYEATVSNIKKSKTGEAGEKNAVTNKEKQYGTISSNEITGIFGIYEQIPNIKTIEVGDSENIELGKATIRTVIEKDKVEEFNINIISIDKNSKTKNILFEITDETLINKTGGIVQGMSGSPIIQNNKIIGAVNYVIVNDTTKGYGIFITTMLEEGDN